MFTLTSFHPTMARADVAKACEVSSEGHVTRYVPQTGDEKEKSVAIVILPPTGGINIFDRHLAAEFCKSGIDASILDYAQIEINLQHNTNESKIVALHNIAENRVHVDADYMQVYQFGSLLVMSELENLLTKYQSSLGDKKIVVVGSSMGGFFTSIIFGAVSKTKQWQEEKTTSLTDSEEKIKSAVERYPHLQSLAGAIIVTAGGSVSEVWSESSRTEIRDAVQLRKQIYNIGSNQEYIRLFDGQNDFDTIKLANPKAKNQILFFNSDADTVVPSKYQEKLWSAWGEPQKVTVGLEHMYAIGEVFMYPTHFRTMLDFLRSTWP